MEIVTKQQALDQDLFQKNEYMIVGCYLSNDTIHIIETHIFAVPLKMFKREMLLSQWIWDFDYYTQSNKIYIPRAVSISLDNDKYAVLPENVPLELANIPNDDEETNDQIQWYFSINNIGIGMLTTENMLSMRYIFYDDEMGNKLFSLYKALFNKMQNYPKEIVEKYNVYKIPIDGIEEVNNKIFN